MHRASVALNPVTHRQTLAKNPQKCCDLEKAAADGIEQRVMLAKLREILCHANGGADILKSIWERFEFPQSMILKFIPEESLPALA